MSSAGRAWRRVTPSQRLSTGANNHNPVVKPMRLVERVARARRSGLGQVTQRRDLGLREVHALGQALDDRRGGPRSGVAAAAGLAHVRVEAAAEGAAEELAAAVPPDDAD